MNPNALLIGNGLNRAVNNVAWPDLLKNLRAKYLLAALDRCSSYPLEFERITLCAIAEEIAKECEIEKEIPKLIIFSHSDLNANAFNYIGKFASLYRKLLFLLEASLRDKLLNVSMRSIS